MRNKVITVAVWIVLIAIIVMPIGITCAKPLQNLTESVCSEPVFTGNTYTFYAQVLWLEPETDEVAIIDLTDGNIFAFYGIEDWDEGDYAFVTATACNTADRTDDIILGATYRREVR